jgi:hypothetical protein
MTVADHLRWSVTYLLSALLTAWPYSVVAAEVSFERRGVLTVLCPLRDSARLDLLNETWNQPLARASNHARHHYRRKLLQLKEKFSRV